MYIFEPIIKFLDSLVGYLSYNAILVIFAGLFLFVTVVVLIATSKAYEVKLIKAIDSFNNYFMDNPQITEENLVAFNQKMKSKKVPKQLRKQWQQFVLYREEKASYYMSFENCVANPLKNSSFKRDLTIYNILTYCLALISLVLNLFFSFEIDNVSALLQHVLLCPALILLVNFIIRIFLEIRNSAVVSDLFQNYQYFETNIDKATTTLPEYVDYEVLFDRAEIKKGIPILYAYLSKRAEQEQRELELARLKNVEHEQFNFDEAGVAASLVLERAMQEAENYIAERKKYNQDTEQINADITQEELNYREITKEYNRQMQVSRETFENFKAQLNEVSSTIEANYLKKQQQQELDRQRNLERDFDTQTERHKKVLESFQAELDSVDKFRGDSRKTLEDAMMSEFKTYNTKVYEEAKKVAEQNEQEKIEKIKAQVKELEETIVSKNKELENVYAENQELNEKLTNMGIDAGESTYVQPEYNQPIETIETDVKEEPVEEIEEPIVENEPVKEEYAESFEEEQPEVKEDENQEETQGETSNTNESVESLNEQDSNETEELAQEGETLDEDLDNLFNKYFEEDDEEEGEEPKEVTSESFEDVEEETEQQPETEEDSEEDKEIENIFEKYFKSELEENKQDENISAEEEEESEVAQQGEEVEQPKSRRGRPRKVVTEEVKTVAKKRGRPRKVVEETKETTKRKVGRPKKVETTEEKVTSKRRGRPRKETVETKVVTKHKVGRPKKSEVKTEEKVVTKKKAGRPKKVNAEVKQTKTPVKRRGRPRKEATETKVVAKRNVGRPKKQETEQKKKVGRPRKTASVDIDAYLKEIDNEIAKENAKIKETRKELEKKAKISKGKK